MTALDFINAPSRVEHHADRDKWLTARHADSRAGYVGSTDVAAILGWSRYAGPWRVWAARHATHLLEPVRSDDEEEDDESDSILLRGLAMEPMLWRRFRQRYGLKVIEPGHIRVKRGRFAVSPDAFIFDPDLGWGVGESKTVMLAHSHWVPRNDEVIEGLDELTSWPMPRAYLGQCLSQALACGLPFCDLFVAVTIDVDDDRCSIATDEFPNVRPHAIVRSARIRVVPTPDDLRALKARLSEWVGRHLVEGKEPPVDDSRTCYLHHLGPDPAARVVKRRADGSEADLIAEYLEHRDSAKAATALQHKARVRLVKAMGDVRSVYALTESGKRITATIGKRGLTVREPRA